MNRSSPNHYNYLLKWTEVHQNVNISLDVSQILSTNSQKPYFRNADRIFEFRGLNETIVITVGKCFGHSFTSPSPQLYLTKQYRMVSENELQPVGRWTRRGTRLDFSSKSS